jgi:hypothetical protein
VIGSSHESTSSQSSSDKSVRIMTQYAKMVQAPIQSRLRRPRSKVLRIQGVLAHEPCNLAL